MQREQFSAPLNHSNRWAITKHDEIHHRKLTRRNPPQKPHSKTRSLALLMVALQYHVTLNISSFNTHFTFKSRARLSSFRYHNTSKSQQYKHSPSSTPAKQPIQPTPTPPSTNRSHRKSSIMASGWSSSSLAYHWACSLCGTNNAPATPYCSNPHCRQYRADADFVVDILPFDRSELRARPRSTTGVVLGCFLCLWFILKSCLWLFVLCASIFLMLPGLFGGLLASWLYSFWF
jgi:hypothetical protein